MGKSRKKYLEKQQHKLQKKLNKITKELEKIEAEESWAMYEPAGCHACHNGQIINPGKDALSITYYSRCKCSYKKTKKYKKFLKNRDKMNYNDAISMEATFYDNNAHITVGNNAVDRSW